MNWFRKKDSDFEEIEKIDEYEKLIKGELELEHRTEEEIIRFIQKFTKYLKGMEKIKDSNDVIHYSDELNRYKTKIANLKPYFIKLSREIEELVFELKKEIGYEEKIKNVNSHINELKEVMREKEHEEEIINQIKHNLKIAEYHMSDAFRGTRQFTIKEAEIEIKNLERVIKLLESENIFIEKDLE